MAYLELHDLIPGERYLCETHDGQRMAMVYVGFGTLESDGGELWSVWGDVRYVLQHIPD